MQRVDQSAIGNLAAELNETVAAIPYHQRLPQDRYGCSVCKALAVLPGDERIALQKAVASPVGSQKLAGILQKNGVRVGVPSIRRHRSEGH